MSPLPRPPGLSTAEAARRLAEHGPNASADREHHGLLTTLRGIATEPMFLLLLGAAALYLVLGSLGEGLLLAFFAVVTVGLVIFQERRSEHALDALRQLAAPQVRVWRDGREQRIAAHDLVPGDLFLLAEGERVAADGRVREAVGLAVDESLLTGESVPVRKQPANDAAGAVASAAARPEADPDAEAAQVYASTLVVAGHALVEATATGSGTRVGHIGASLAGIETAPTPLQIHLKRLVRVFGVAALVASGALVLWHGLVRGEWMQGVLSAIALGMAMLPEEFPMALAVFLSLGAWRLARIQVLARRPAVIEALGSATVLCVDKTGTLTENRMQVRRLVTTEADVTVAPGTLLDPNARPLLATAMRASRRGGIDPMDRALVEQADAALAGTPDAHADWQLAQEYPLTPELLAMTLVWTDAQGQRHLAAKGAPEAVFELCHLPPPEIAGWLTRVQALAGQGLRVLAVARGIEGGDRTGDGAAAGTHGTHGPDGMAPADHQHDHDYRFLGLVAFEDPLRPSVPGAVAQARAAGIAVAMITGDHAATALAIAGQAGIDTAPGALTGAQIAALDDTALDDAVRRVRVYARVQPEQKLRLVQALRRNGETVAMTGDGVNDAPALKAAHIGIAMGVRGTDVAREAAGLVLLDEDFGRIVGGVRMGRRIFDNLRKVMVYITAIHVPIVGLALLPLLFGLPPLMLPAHVVLTEMVIDPVCSLAFEGAPEDPRLMSRPPRHRDDGIVGWPMLRQGLWQGGSLLAATLAIYLVALDAGRATDIARTLAVLGLTAGNLMLVAVNTTAGLGWRALGAPGARAFWWVAALATAALTVAVMVPGARALLHFGVPTWSDLGLSLALVAAAVAVGGAISMISLRRSDAVAAPAGPALPKRPA